MSEPQPKAEPDFKPASILRRMFETGEWSDLKIQTETRTFDVHKSVMCPASPFFQAACSREWKEAKTGVICLPESATVVGGLVAYCYGIFDPEKFNHKGECDWLQVNCELLIAARKYDLPGLQPKAEEEIIDALWEGSLMDKIEIATWLYEGERRYEIGAKMMRQIVSLLTLKLGGILTGNEDTEWRMLQACPELMKDVLRFAARKSSRVEETFLLWSPSYMQLVSDDEQDSDSY